MAIVASVFAVVIIVLAFALGVFDDPAPKPTFSIVSHDGRAVSNTTEGFYAMVSFTVRNDGTVAGNVTVIFKVITDIDDWGGAQAFYLTPGQSASYTKDTIFVEGDPDSDWVYQCFIQGKKAVDFPHS